MRKNIIRVFCALLLFVFTISTVSYAYSSYGSKGSEVTAIQKRLSALGYYDGVCDGVFGKETQKALIEYQNNNSLSADGIAGTKTLSSLKVINSRDAELLAMVINGEARGESYTGQVAVGAVVLNRIQHPAFPDTLQGVIYQKGAFTAVKDGQINLKVTDSCKKAAVAALSGADPTNGAVYYYNPETATCKWIKTRQVIKRIGNHLFCK